MTVKQTLLWTVLPNGIDVAGSVPRARFSVHVGVRLDGGPGASRFGDFEMSDWPTKEFDFGVRFVGPDNTPVELPAIQVAPSGGSVRPDAELWSRLFPGDLDVVTPRVSTLPDQRIRSYSAENARRIAHAVYTDVAATHPTEPPSLATLASDHSWFRAIRMYSSVEWADDLRPALRDELEGALDRGLWPGTPPGILRSRALGHLPVVEPGSNQLDVKAVQLNVIQHQAFLEPNTLPRYIDPTNNGRVPEQLAPPTFDFHQALSILGNHPVVMRRVGLIRDFVVDLSPIGWFGGSTANCTVQLLLGDVPFDQPTVSTSPKTAAVISIEKFLSRTDGITELLGYRPEADGMLPLEDPERFQTIEVDADGAVVKTADFVQRSHLQLTGTSDAPTAPAAVPSLRSFGLSVAERDRAALLSNRFGQKADNATALADGRGDDVTFHLEDLNRGIRLDVWDSTAGRWFSLLRRIGRYEVGRGNEATSFEVTDEGWVSAAPTEGKGSDAPDLYLQETLALWSGWSLAAPQPGAPADAKGNAQPSDGNPASSNIALSAAFRAEPGTLPVLRFGREYRFRARRVDLAGNDVGFGDERQLGAHVTAPVRYRRFEPVAAPLLLPRAPSTAGETVDRLVIRSDIDTSVDTPAERHMAPPRTSQLTAEQHGAFDTPGGLSRTAYAAIAARDRFSIETSEQGSPDPSTPDQRYFDVDVFDVGYLTDPLAVGAVFTGLPGTGPDERIVVSFVDPAALWPARRPLRVRLVEGMGRPELVTEGAAQVLVVQSPKGWVSTAQVASVIPENQATLDLLGLWGWLEEAGLADGDLAGAILEARHWMVTPSRPLTFVHAVRRPLVRPSADVRFERFGLPGALARFGTLALLTVRSTFEPRSTQRLELIAAWSDPVDSGLPRSELRPPGQAPNVESAGSAVDGDGNPIRVSKRVTVRGLTKGIGTESLDKELEHDVGDLKHHVVDYSVLASGGFSDYFVETMLTVASTSSTLLHSGGVAAGSVKVTAVVNDAPTVFTPGVDYTVDEAAGTLRCTGTGTLEIGSIIEVSYVPGPVTQESEVVRVVIPASAPPLRPSIVYAIPTFGWKATTTGRSKKQSTRLGNGVRVYLDRPWWSSGDGELLGVVLWDPPVGVGGSAPLEIRPEALARYVTQYGDDPISGQNTRVTRAPRLTDFARATSTLTGVSPVEMPGQPVAVAGHPVAFDEDRKLWYSDIELNLGLAYFPFVRLALARFQPSANPGCHLSEIVLADFVQLAPDRKATVNFDLSNPLALNVTVAGVSYQSIRSAGRVQRNGPTEIRVTVERQDVPAAGDAGWAPVDGLTSVALTALSLPYSATTAWTGMLTLTSSRLSVPQRLVIEEFEVRDPGSATPQRVDVDGNRVDGRRLVYTDIIRL